MFLMGNFFTPMFLMIFLIVEYWFLLEKTGENGWKMLIPFYGTYTLYNVAREKKLFWYLLGVVGAMMITSVAYVNSCIVRFMGFAFIRNAANFDSMLLATMLVAECVLLVVIDIKWSLALSKVFGKSTGFGAGIAFLEVIFLGILVFDENVKYVKEENVAKENWPSRTFKEIEEVERPIKNEKHLLSDSIDSVEHETIEDEINVNA